MLYVHNNIIYHTYIIIYLRIIYMYACTIYATFSIHICLYLYRIYDKGICIPSRLTAHGLKRLAAFLWAPPTSAMVFQEVYEHREVDCVKGEKSERKHKKRRGALDL